ncbi:MAG: tetratricopeptide repeat protein [Planctomycetes bacterium]|nr:tetratricopeptide repeat protein [Planctomycetota bacterium]
MKSALKVTLAAVVLLAPSCGTLKQKIRGPVDAVVTLPSSTPGQLEQCIVSASPNSHAEAGVRALRAGDWELAKTGFSQALVDDSHDHASHYGKGLAYELSGDLPMALACYEIAVRFSPAQPNPDYAAAIERVKAKLTRG